MSSGLDIPELSGLATAAELAHIFTQYSPLTRGGERVVSERNVRSWWERRASTGMPDPDPVRRPSRNGPAIRQWDIMRALSWFWEWSPKRPGAPLGNQNALQHGGCVGLRAARQERAAGISPQAPQSP